MLLMYCLDSMIYYFLMVLFLYYYLSEENFKSHNHCSFLSCVQKINVFGINLVRLLKLKMTTYFTAPH